ncbi:MAG: GTP-binding protein [Pseudonocardia sp.]|nr:GTP-binding protein [Pseudonocardia sp.]
MPSRTPVTLLTGFLGSGKTTLVNHLLTERPQRRIAVIVNEFGELGIDSALIANRDDEVLELANGCVCCASRGDLIRAIRTLVSADHALDHLLVEGSGLADPGPVVEALVNPPLAELLAYRGTVTCVDAANFDANLEHAEAAYNQLSHADLLIINKIDLVKDDIARRIRQGLRLINSTAPQLPAVRCAVPASAVLDPGSVSIERDQRLTSAHAPGDHFVTSVTVTSEHALDTERLRRWLSGLPGTVIRAKGIVQLSGHAAPRAVHVVSGSVALEDLPTRQQRPDRSVLVLIGTDLDEPTLRTEFVACAG